MRVKWTTSSHRSCFLLLSLALMVAIPDTASAYTTIDSCPSVWPDSDLPVGYRLNENPPTSIPDIEDVRRIFADSFEAWTSPCCSSFSVTDMGTTTATAEDQRDSLFVMSFREESWNPALGDQNSTLGVTLPLFYPSTCEIVSADVVFNAYKFTFVDGAPRGTWDADLQSIATHEFGHFLGLGHTSIYDATMYGAYTGGTGARSLHQDDLDGVCDLYPQACNCENDSQCNGNQECIDGVCQIPPCQSDDDCDPGLQCAPGGDCIIPPCDSDDDCAGSYICGPDGVCVPDQDCPICGECSDNVDCGVQGICIPAGYISSQSHCSSWCNSSADCPGNTDCYEVPTDDGTYYLCFNDDAETSGPCPAGFICEDDDTDPDLCVGVSCPETQVCNPATGLCQGGSTTEGCVVCDGCNPSSANSCGSDGTCLDFVDGPSVCSIPCNPDGSCPGNSACFQLEDTDGTAQNWCLNNDAPTVGICSDGWVCVEEEPTSLCDGVVCPEDSTCNPDTGGCELGPTQDPGTPENPDAPDLPDLSNDQDDLRSDDDERDKNGNVGCFCTIIASGPNRSAAGSAMLAFIGAVWFVRRRWS